MDAIKVVTESIIVVSLVVVDATTDVDAATIDPRSVACEFVTDAADVVDAIKDVLADVA